MKQKPNRSHFALTPLAESITRLLHPYAEVVIHNLKTEKIDVIFNPFSKREAGDESLLEKEHDFNQGPDVIGPYPKINWDGKKLKSITSVIRDDQGQAQFLMCINLDISGLEQLKHLILPLLGEEFIEQPKSLFKDDWREKINAYVDQHLRENHRSIARLTKEEQQELVRQLRQEGAFDGKNAAEYIGQILGLSRATVYNYLNK